LIHTDPIERLGRTDDLQIAPLSRGFDEGSAPRRVYQFGSDFRFACFIEFNSALLKDYNLIPGAGFNATAPTSGRA